MAEYIKREDVFQRLCEYCSRVKYCDKQDCVDARILDSIPAADVVPVVRCKDCRHIHIWKDVYYCRYWERWEITPNGFCSSGAKMDGEV